MELQGAIAVVTGANRGLGRHLAEQLVHRGAAKVYAATRRPDTVAVPGTLPLRLDVTDADSIRAAAEMIPDITLLINNAGSSTGATLLDGTFEDIRLEMETHFFGTLATTRAFAPALTSHGGAILNVVSVLSWVHPQALGAYSSAKAALWAQTDSVRAELAPQGVRVTALHVGYMDTDMAADVTDPKMNPADVARLALDGVAAGTDEVLADEVTRSVKAGLADALQ